MNRTTILLTLLCSFIWCQATFAADTTRLAPVSVKVTDMKDKPTKGQQIFFRSKSKQTLYSGKSDASGKFFIQLPMGDEYLITVKSLTDTSKYGVINIPALAADEEYTEPFTVNVKFSVARTYTLDKVYFDFGKATFRKESFPVLKELAEFLASREDISIEIAGHTDNVGKDPDNLKLSQQRADAIRNYLIQNGIKSNRLTAKGYGATMPIADNSTDEGRQKNRRTEVRIL